MSENKVFAKNTMFNYLSKTIPAIASFVFTLIISNYLGPELYGIYNYLPAVLVGFATLFGGEFFNNILWTFTARYKSRNFFKKIMIIQMVIVLVLFAAINLLGPVIMKSINVSHQEFLGIASILLILMPLNTIFITLFKGFSRFGKTLKAALLENTITLIAASILIIFLGWGIYGAFFARILALIVSITYYLIETRKLDFSEKKVNIKEVKQYGGWNLASSIVRNINLQTITITFGLFLNATILGIYYLGQKLIAISIGNVTNAIMETLWSKNSENHKNKKKISVQTSFAIKTSVLITAVLSIPLVVVLPYVIKLLFPAYTDLIPYIPLFIIYSIVSAQGPITSVFNSINKTKNNFKVTLVELVMAILVVIPATYFVGLLGLLISNLIMLQVSYSLIKYWLKKQNIYIEIIPRINDLKRIISIIKKINTRKR